MNQHQIDENKLTIKSFDDRIKDLEGRVRHLEQSKNEFMESIVNHELNCSGPGPDNCSCPGELELSFGSWKCEVSPVGICVYDYDDDPAHDHCIFCGDPEERK